MEASEGFPGRRSWAVITLGGVLDARTVTALRRQARKLLRSEGPRLILEVSALDDLDASGVGVLVDLLSRIRARGGRMALAGVRDTVRHVLTRDEAAGRIPVYASVGDALLALGRPENDLDD